MPPKQSLIGTKRKAVSENLPDQAPQGNHDQLPFPEHSQNRQLVLRHSQGQLPLLQQSDSQRPPPNQIGSFWCNICKMNCGNAFNLKCHFQGKKHQAKWAEVSQCMSSEPSGNEVKRRKNTRKHASSNSTSPNQVAYFWCNLCKVNCGNAFNLECHSQGKKHKAKWDEVFGSRKTIPEGKKVNRKSKNTKPSKPSFLG